MPIHLPAHNRRQFLFTVGAGLVACATESVASDIDGTLVYLLNDTHIGEKQPSDSPVPSHLRQVVEELTRTKRKPACVLINGDLALNDGQPGDYRHFAKLVAPLREAGMDLNLTLGNHDNRDVFYNVLTGERPETAAVESRHISVVRTHYANFFLLDSLHETNVTPGTLGEAQRQWLADALDTHPDKPAIIMTHHNPRLGGDPVHFPGGLTDSTELWEVLASRNQVKAYIHGHIHDRNFFEHEGIHILNMPATSYVADPKLSTTGWTLAELSAVGVTLTTKTNDPDHPWNNQAKTLTWRT